MDTAHPQDFENVLAVRWLDQNGKRYADDLLIATEPIGVNTLDTSRSIAMSMFHLPPRLQGTRD